MVWKQFRSAANRFSVPRDSQVREEKDQDFVQRRYTVRLNGRGFNVSCSDFGENIPEKFIEGLMTSTPDHMVAGMKAKLLDDQSLKCGSYPGRRFAFSGPEGWVSVKMCVAGRMSCLAQATNCKGLARRHRRPLPQLFKFFPPAAR